MGMGQIIADYRAGRINRQQFIRRFGDWQKACGINYEVKSEFIQNSVTGGFIGLTYRGQNAVLDGKRIAWIRANGVHPKTGMTRFQRYEAASIAEFRRKVDFVICRQLRESTWR